MDEKQKDNTNKLLAESDEGMCYDAGEMTIHVMEYLSTKQPAYIIIHKSINLCIASNVAPKKGKRKISWIQYLHISDS